MTETRGISKRLINFVLVLMIRELLRGYEPHPYPIMKLKEFWKAFLDGTETLMFSRLCDDIMILQLYRFKTYIVVPRS